MRDACSTPYLLDPANENRERPMRVLRLWLPLAYVVFFAGLVLSILARCSDRAFRVEDGILSDLFSRIDNPRGYLIACSAITICGLALLPVASFIQQRLHGASRLSAVSGWLYRLGVFATIAVGLTTPFQRPYVAVHIYLSFFSFMAMVAGLMLGFAAVARTTRAGKSFLWWLAAMQVAFLLFLGYLLVKPGFFHNRRDALAICEWVMCISIGVCTTLLAIALPRSSQDIPRRLAVGTG